MCFCFLFLFFKQKTAYEMRISDWSSDVCSSDLTFRSIAETMFRLTNMVMRYAPVGVFALIAVTVATFGFSSLIPLAKLVVLVYVAIVLFALIVLGGVARLFGFNIFTLIRLLKDELILAYSTASSETVLPRIMEKMTN